MGKSKIYTSIIVLIILSLIVVGYAFYSPKPIEETYFYDKDLGLIKIEVGNPSLFQQTAVFDTTSAKVGEIVNMREQVDCESIPNSYFNNPSKSGITSVKVDLKTPSGSQVNIYEQSFPGTEPCSNFPQIKLSFIALNTGRYTAVSSFTTTLQSSPGYQSLNHVDVTSSTPTTPSCGSDSGWGNWRFDKNIPGGTYEVREYLSFDNSCNEYTSDTDYRTLCSSGFVISGTTSTTGIGKKSCVAKSPTPTPTPTPSPTPEIGTGCNADMIVECSDGSVITTQVCTDGILNPTDDKCQETSKTITTKSGDTITTTTTTPSGDTVTTTNEIDDKEDIFYKDPLILTSIILGILLIGGLIWWFMKR